MRLRGGPANGREIPAPKDGWAWVDVEGDRLRVYDLGLPEDQQHTDRKHKGQWQEYLPDPRLPGVMRWERQTPPREG